MLHERYPLVDCILHISWEAHSSFSEGVQTNQTNIQTTASILNKINLIQILGALG